MHVRAIIPEDALATTGYSNTHVSGCIFYVDWTEGIWNPQVLWECVKRTKPNLYMHVFFGLAFLRDRNDVYNTSHRL